MADAVPSLLRQKEVSKLTGLSRSSLYSAMQRGEFPKNIRLTQRTVAWPSSVVHDWINARISNSTEAA